MQDRIKTHEQFSMPFSLDVSELIVSKKRDGITDKFADSYKQIICDGLSKNKSLHAANDYVSDKLNEREGGLWFVSIEHCKSIGNYSVCFQDNNAVSYKFERNESFYLISLIKTCNDNCWD